MELPGLQIDRGLFVTQKSIKTYDGGRVDVLVDDLGDDLVVVDVLVDVLLVDPRRDASDALRLIIVQIIFFAA